MSGFVSQQPNLPNAYLSARMANLDFTQSLPVTSALNFGAAWVAPPPPPPVRRVVSASGQAWGRPARVHPVVIGGARTPAAKNAARHIPWGAAPRINAVADAPWRDKGRREGAILPFSWERLRPAAAQTGAIWRIKAKRDNNGALPWTAPPARQAENAGVYRSPAPHWMDHRLCWGALRQYGLPLALIWTRLTWRQKRWGIPWGEGRAAPSVWPLPAIVPPAPPQPGRCDYQPVKGRADFDFRQRLPVTTKLQFWCHAPTEYLIDRSLILLPTATLVKLPAREPISATQLSLDLDIDSWAWSLRATVPASSLALIMPGNDGAAEIEINLSGHIWRMLVEGFAESHEFGAAAYTVTGRSTAAILAAPYAPTRTYTQNNERTARQLADEELVNTGWRLDWKTEDWRIDGGVWSYDALTPLDAIARIAASVGAVILPHPSEKILTIFPRYRFSPWNLTTAAANHTLDPALLTGLSLQWSPQPKYNGVYTSGQHQGVTVFTRRAGSAGERLAQMVVDALITTPAAGQERGRQILCAAGNKAKIAVTLPLTAHGALPGLVQPGAVIEVPESPSWKGIATAVGITAEMQNDALVLKQHVEIERHYE